MSEHMRRFDDGAFWKTLKYFALLLPFLTAAFGYGIIRNTTETNSSDIAITKQDVKDLQQRIARVEQAISRIPDIDKKVDEILIRVRK